MCRIAGPTSSERLDDELVERPGARERAEDDEHRHVLRQLEDLARLGLRNRPRARRESGARRRGTCCPSARRADRRGTRASRTARRAGSQARARRPLRSAQPGSRAFARRAPSARRRSRRRRGRHPAGAPEDPPAVERRGAREEERPRECGRRPPREAADAERVELVARLRNEPRFDAIRRPGERHVYASRRQRFRDRERGQDVTGRPAGCDQTPKLLLRSHDWRC